MANEIEEANALTRQALELAGREQDMLERAHPSADTHEFQVQPCRWGGGGDQIAPEGTRWFFVSITSPGYAVWARKKERQENGK